MGMIRYYFMGMVLSLVGISLGYLLLPSVETLALMHLRDQDYAKALELFEQQMEGGRELPVSAIMPLSTLYLQNGQVEQAILVLEKFLDKVPEHLEARKELGKLYQYAQRPMDYLENLEILHRLEPTMEVLQQLANLYSFSGDIARQVRILEEMRRRFPRHVAGYRDQARLLMAGGEFERTVAVLLELKGKTSGGMDAETLQMLVYALLNLGRKDEALAEARDWLGRQGVGAGREGIAVVTELLRQGGGGDLAWLWVEDLRRLMPDSMEILLQWGQVAAATGRGALALPIVEDLYLKGKLPLAGVALLSELAVRLRRFGMAVRVISSLPEGERPYWLQLVMGESVLIDGGGFSARRVLQVLERKFLEGYPVLAAELHLRAGSTLETFQEWLERGRKRDLEPEWRLRLASLLLRLGRTAEGGEILMALARDANARDGVYREIAGYFIQSGDVAGGVRFFEQLRRERPGRAVEESWFILTVRLGDRQEGCLAWLAGQSSLTNPFLTDVVNHALDTRQLRLAEAGLTRLLGQPLDNPMSVNGREWRDRTILSARLDLVRERPMAALERLKPIRPWLDDVGIRFYEEVVIAAWRTRQPVRKEVMGILRSRLDTPWSDMTPEARREYGMLALETGERNMGTRAVLDSVHDAPPESPEVAQVLYVLGPRPGPEGLRWLLDRAERASDQNLGGWLDILTGVGAARQGLLIASSRLPAPGQNPPLMDAIIRALAWEGNSERMEELLADEMHATMSIQRLHSLAKLAEEKNLPKPAGKIYQKILEIDPEDKTALKRLGYMAFYAGEWENVVGYLGRYLARFDDNYEPFFYLAEVYRSLGMVEKAKPFYLKALARIGKIENPPYTVRVAWVRMYQRIGRWSEALKGYEALMREQSDDARLRADYVELLLARGMTREAENVLQFAGVR
ncbi:MAG: tetratricopeptide repeat protein [Magnetococcales bacterium]|nr:tetratricopeptide repeat protein [Magnetococcales bacterium]